MPKKSAEELDIIAQLATTSLSPTESKPQGIQKSEPRKYNFVSSSVGAQHSTEDDTEEEDDEVQIRSNSPRKLNYACTECRKAHKACSGGRPCERCAKLGLGPQCHSSQRKKRHLTKKYWFDFLQQQQAQQQNGNVVSPKQPIFVDHFAVENMKQQMERTAVHGQKQQQQQQQEYRTRETFQFSNYVPPVPMPQNYRPENQVTSPRSDLYISPRGSLEQQFAAQRLSSPRSEMYNSPRGSIDSITSPRGELNAPQHSPRFVQGYPQQQQQMYDARMQQTPLRVDQMVSPRMQTMLPQTTSPRQVQYQPSPITSPRYNAMPNSTSPPQVFDSTTFTQQNFENVGANLYQSPRNPFSPRITEQNQSSPRMGILSPRLVEQNMTSPRNVQYSPTQLSNSPRGTFSPRNSFSSPTTSLESYKIGRPNAVMSPTQEGSLPSLPQLDELTNPRFVQKFMDHPFVERQPSQHQYQQHHQNQQHQNMFHSQQWRNS
jgi:ribosomal protein L44E